LLYRFLLLEPVVRVELTTCCLRSHRSPRTAAAKGGHDLPFRRIQRGKTATWRGQRRTRADVETVRDTVRTVRDTVREIDHPRLEVRR
jgi:hypothetical protein